MACVPVAALICQKKHAVWGAHLLVESVCERCVWAKFFFPAGIAIMPAGMSELNSSKAISEEANFLFFVRPQVRHGANDFRMHILVKQAKNLEDEITWNFEMIKFFCKTQYRIASTFILYEATFISHPSDSWMASLLMVPL